MTKPQRKNLKRARCHFARTVYKALMRLPQPIRLSDDATAELIAEAMLRAERYAVRMRWIAPERPYLYRLPGFISTCEVTVTVDI